MGAALGWASGCQRFHCSDILAFPVPVSWRLENAPFAATEVNDEGVGEALQKLDNVLPLSPQL